MAKTKLLEEIDTHQLDLTRRLHILYETCKEQANEDNPQIKVLGKLLDEATLVRVKMNAACKKMQEKIDSWDGSTKLKNLFKDKAQLAFDRKEAKRIFGIVKVEVAELNELYDKTHKLYSLLEAIHN